MYEVSMARRKEMGEKAGMERKRGKEGGGGGRKRRDLQSQEWILG
jgi:hypothetical protein